MQMQTRLEKYRNYRQEIMNDGLLLDRLSNESSTIKKYKLKIDELNPKILSDITNTSTIANIISINKKNYSEIKELNDFSKLIEEQKLLSITDEIEEWLNNANFHSVLDKNGNLSNEWLNEDKNYVEINKNEKNLVDLSNTWAAFQIVSKDQIDKIDELIKNKDIVNEFKKTKITELDENKFNHKSFKKIYIGSLIACLSFLLIMIILLIVKIIN